MTFQDFVIVSTGNLRRMKLRTFLTTSGVVIAIAAFVAMLSFGAGNQRYVARQFEKLGLFTAMQVRPKKAEENGDTTKAAVLDRAAVDRLSKIPGVNIAYPYEAITVRARLGDSAVAVKAQTLAESAIRTKLFSRFLSGRPFAGDSAREILATGDFMKAFGIKSADSLVGKSLVVSVKVSSVDSGLVHILTDRKESFKDRLKRIAFDSLRFDDYRRRVIRGEVNGAVGRFVDGFFNAREEITDTLTICGVLESDGAERIRIGSIIIPAATAERFTSGFSGDPTELLAALNSGTLFSQGGERLNKSYPVVTLDLDPHVLHKTVRDSVEALGFRAFSFAEEFDEIRRFFIYFDMALAVIGLVALVTASLGIINTMVMSILERKREIGVLKSLGADERDIRLLFLAESGMIGVMGSLGGIAVGWLISRAASAVAIMIMANEGMPEIELFALPVWLILTALAIGVAVSLLAGFYPASRAARVDPIEALRNE
jgi:ABC-type antimicrobial peptide transport system permease subunit